jgi:anti-sigma factor RsiW
MPKGNHKASDGRALWHRARGSTLGAMAERAPDVDQMDMAAYLDGGLDEATRARVEAALAGRPDRLELLIAARAAVDALETEAVSAPEAVVARAQALAPDAQWPARSPVRSPVRSPAPTWAGRASAWLAGVAGPAFAPRRGLALAGVAAGFLAIGVAGFELGRAEAMYSAEVDDLLAQEFATLIAPYGEDLL